MEEIYQNALRLMHGGLYLEAAAAFERIIDYKDSRRLIDECMKKNEERSKDEIYDSAVDAASVFTVGSQEKAIRLFESIPGWRDSEERAKASLLKIDEIKQVEADKREEIRIRDEKKQKARKKLKKALLIGALALAAAAGLFFAGSHLYKTTIEPRIKYHKGVALMEAGDPDGAYRYFKGLDFKDSAERLRTIAIDRFEGADVGSTVLFGSFEQDSNIKNGMELIEWLVVDRNDDKLLLVSKYAIECAPFHWSPKDGAITTWDNCELRSWLNSSFIDMIFDQPERQLILRSSVKAEANPEYATDPGYDTTDKLFLLSISETEKYFPEKEDRLCRPTKFAHDCGAYVGGTEYCWWWLRTTGFDSFPSRTVVVSSQGEVIYIGHYVTCYNYAVRPAMWVSTKVTGPLPLKPGA